MVGLLTCHSGKPLPAGLPDLVVSTQINTGEHLLSVSDQQVTLAAKLDDLHLIPRTHVMKGESQHKLSSDYMYVCAHM